MKTCPLCKQENPSAANHCMFCGSLLVEEEQLPEEVVLRKQLADANETIKQLKESLALLQSELKNTSNDTEIKQLKKQISEKNKIIATFSSRVDSQNNEIAKLTKQLSLGENKNGKKWKIVWALLFLVMAITFCVTWNNCQEKVKQLRYGLADVEKTFVELKGQYPLIIDDIQVENSSFDVKTEFDSVYSSKDMYYRKNMCLKLKLLYRGFVDSTINFNVKLINPEGTLICNPQESPEGFSFSQMHNIREGSLCLELKSWCAKRRWWASGTYRIEIWCGDVMLKSKTFDYYKTYKNDVESSSQGRVEEKQTEQQPDTVSNILSHRKDTQDQTKTSNKGKQNDSYNVGKSKDKQTKSQKKEEVGEDLKNPFKIHSIEVANTYYSGTTDINYGNPIYSSNTMYLKPRVNIECFINGTVELDTKLYRPNGSLVTTQGGNGKPKSGYTTSTTINMKKGVQTINMRSWGGSTYRGNWMAGDYKCEIYYNDELIYEQTIHIY